MPAFICATCGVQFAPSETTPSRCPICEDERQYVGWKGQTWTTLEEIRRDHRNELTDEERSLTSILTIPTFAIGQRAFLVQTSAGNILWDCISCLDEATVDAIKQRGGLQAIAICHPHFYGSCVEWSEAFGGVPIYIAAADRQWVMRPSRHIVFFEEDEIEPLAGLTLLRLGGHFEGSTVLHRPGGAEGRGVLLSGDTVAVGMDRRSATVMYSYPNQIPVSARTVRTIADRLRPFDFDRIYSAFQGKTIITGAKEALERSIDRYVERLTS